MKFYMNESEMAMLKGNWPDLYENIKDNIELYEPLIRKADLNQKLNDKLGALTVEHGYRVASDQEVPGIRNLGLTPDTVLFDEPHSLTDIYSSGEPSVTSQRWLAHRSVCRRTLLECLSGGTHHI